MPKPRLPLFLSAFFASLALAGSVCRPVEAGETFDAALCDAAPNCDWVQSDSGCCDGIGDAMDCGCGQGLMGLLGGLIKPSDHSFDDFVSPMINFVFFEDPRTLTELRPIFVNHWVPGTIGTGIPAGGSIQLLAMQFRVAITERLSVIAVKDGYIFDNTGGALNGLLDDGWADVTAGLKYNVYRNVETGTLGSLGFTYEMPVGSGQALQSIGDGEFHLFGSFGQRFLGDNMHYLSTVGCRLPVDNNVQSSAIHWDHHLDVKVTDKVYLFTEFAWWHWTSDASLGLPLGVNGQDLFNLPSSNVAGNDLLTESIGVKLKPARNIEIGLAYEFPLTGFQDVIQSRLMCDFIIRY